MNRRITLIAIVLAIFLSAFGAEAKKAHFIVEPMGRTKVLSEADSLALYACPAFHKGVITYNTEKDVNDAMAAIQAYFQENPLDGEYSIMAADMDAKTLVGYNINLRHHSARHDAAANEARSWGKTLLLALLTVLFGFITLKLFSTQKVKVLCRILGFITGILTLYTGILAAIALFALAFKYICIILGAVLVLVFALSVFGSFSKDRKAESDKRASRQGWVVNGTVYASKDAAEEAARNTGSDIHFKG